MTYFLIRDYNIHKKELHRSLQVAAKKHVEDDLVQVHPLQRCIVPQSSQVQGSFGCFKRLAVLFGWVLL